MSPVENESSRMSFHFDLPIAPEANSLRDRYLFFLTNDVGYRLPGATLESYRRNWSVMFDHLLKKRTFKTISAVLKYYFDQVRSGGAYVHREPDTFCTSFPVLLGQCRRRFNPLDESEFKPLIDEFSRYRWHCDREILVATLGQSLLNLRRFKKAVDDSGLSQSKKDYIKSSFGSNFSVIRKRLLPRQPWSAEMTYWLPKPIEYSDLCEEASGLLRSYGMNNKSIKKEFMDVVCGDRPR